MANCFWFVSPTDHHLVVRTLREIAAGQELLLAYRNPRDPARIRQAVLHSEHGFECTCAVCMADKDMTVHVRDTREADMAQWNALAARAFDGERVSRREVLDMYEWIHQQRPGGRVAAYRPHDVRHAEYLAGCLEWMQGEPGGACVIQEAVRPLSEAEELDESQVGSAPDPVMDMVKMMRAGVMLLSAQSSQDREVGFKLMDWASQIHDVLFGEEREWSLYLQQALAQ